MCKLCAVDVAESVPSRCYRCYAATRDFEVCGKCRRKSHLKHVWVATEYNGTPKQLVHVLKFARAKSAAGDIADMLAAILPYFDEQVVITNIPAATSRVRIRGYDHAELIAKCLTKKLSRQHLRILIRHGQSRQVGSKRTERLLQLKGAFQVTKEHLVKDAHILLVDDVVTTGATLEEAAKTLKKAGARQVDAVVFTQKL